MALYKLQAKTGEDTKDFVIKNPDGNPRTIIPFESSNVDYQEYLEWLKIDGNVPEEAD